MLPAVFEQADLLVAPDQRGKARGPGHVDLAGGLAPADHPVQFDRPGEPADRLSAEGLDLVESHDEPTCLLGHHDPTRLDDVLHAIRDVGCLADDRQPFARLEVSHDGQAAVDRGPGIERDPSGRAELLVQASDAVEDRQAGVDRPAGGVLVGHRVAKAGLKTLRGHHGDGPSEPDDRLAASTSEVDQEFVLFLGIEGREGGLDFLQLAPTIDHRDLPAFGVVEPPLHRRGVAGGRPRRPRAVAMVAGLGTGADRPAASRAVRGRRSRTCRREHRRTRPTRRRGGRPPDSAGPTEVFGQVARRGIALGDPLGHRLQADPLQFSGNRPGDLAGGLGLVVADLPEELADVLGPEGPPAAEHRIQDHPQAIDIGAAVDPVAFPPGLLGRHVRRGAQHGRRGAARLRFRQGEPEVDQDR